MSLKLVSSGHSGQTTRDRQGLTRLQESCASALVELTSRLGTLIGVSAKYSSLLSSQEGGSSFDKQRLESELAEVQASIDLVVSKLGLNPQTIELGRKRRLNIMSIWDEEIS